MVIDFPGEFRPGGATSPQGTPEWHLKFLAAEEDATTTLMSFFQQARLELEDFIRTGDLTKSDANFYRALLDETNIVGSKLNTQSATWVSSTIPEAYSAGRRQTSSVVIPERALQALSGDPLRLLTQTSDMMRRQVRQAVATGILEGLSGADLRSRIIQTGLQNIPRWPSVEYRAGVIARTETMKAYNNGNIDGLVDNGARFVRWIASPDEATCPICLPRDGHVFSIDADGGEPYPDARPLSVVGRPPVHPRCRCTVRAEYRGPDGHVMAGPTIEAEPKLPADAMGADKPPTLPPATGDWNKAVGGLKGMKADYLAGKNIDAQRNFWRNLPPLTDDQLRTIAAHKGGDYIDGYLIARWGARFTGTSWGENAKFYTMRALERVHALDASYLKDSPFLQFIGKPPTGSRLGGSAIAACWPSGHIGVSMTKWIKYLEGQALRAGPGVNAGEEVILHEFMHALHNEFGLSEQARMFGPQKGTTLWGHTRETPGGLSFRSFEAEWKSIPTRREVAPNTSNIADYEVMIENYRASLESVKRTDPGNSSRIQIYEGLVEKYETKIAELRDSITNGGASGGHDYYPTEYAKRGGYAEDFAESNMLFHLNPNLLRRWAPGRYEFIRKHVAMKEK